MTTQMTPESSRRSGPTSRLWVLLVCATVNLYLLGAATLLLAVQYPLLGEVGTAALPAFHASLSQRLGVAFILPEFLAFLSVLPLLRFRPEGVSVAAVWVCVALGVVYFAITFGWHLPAHTRLAEGDASPAVMQQLLTSHAIRTGALALKCGLLLWMISTGGARDYPAALMGSR